MSWEDIKEFIGESAPVIGTLLGGPAGGAVGGLIAKTLGTNNSPEDILTALNSNPDALIKIKELETSKELAILQAQLEATKVNINAELEKTKYLYDDTKDARAMTVSVQETLNASWLAKNTAYILDFIIIIATITLGLMLFFVIIPQENMNIANIMFGAMLSYCSTVFGYHRGSSKGSTEKQEFINKLSEVTK